MSQLSRLLDWTLAGAHGWSGDESTDATLWAVPVGIWS